MEGTGVGFPFGLPDSELETSRILLLSPSVFPPSEGRLRLIPRASSTPRHPSGIGTYWQ
jgi:hypothetical protein